MATEGRIVCTGRHVFMKDETGGRIRSSSPRIRLSLEEKHMSSFSEMDGDALFKLVNIDDIFLMN